MKIPLCQRHLLWLGLGAQLAACQHAAPPTSPFVPTVRMELAPPLVLAEVALADEDTATRDFRESLWLVAGPDAARQLLLTLGGHAPPLRPAAAGGR